MSGTRHLFDACGVEIDHAIGDRSLDVVSVADRVLQEASGSDRPVDECRRAARALHGADRRSRHGTLFDP